MVYSILMSWTALYHPQQPPNLIVLPLGDSSLIYMSGRDYISLEEEEKKEKTKNAFTRIPFIKISKPGKNKLSCLVTHTELTELERGARKCVSQGSEWQLCLEGSEDSLSSMGQQKLLQCYLCY